MIYWIWLMQIPFIGPVTARYLIEELKDPKSIYQADAEYLVKMSGLNERQRKSILQNHSLENPKKFLKTARIITSLFYAGMTGVILHVQRNRMMHL